MSTTTPRRSFASQSQQTDSLTFARSGRWDGQLLAVARVIGQSRSATVEIGRHLAKVRIETTFGTSRLDDVDTTDVGVLPTSTRSPGIPFQDLGWTEDEFNEAADRMSHMRDVWDHDELDDYNVYLTR